MPFLEAIRQFRLDVGRENTIYVHLTLVPFIGNRRRAQDQADPAQRSRPPIDRHPARHPVVPHRPLLDADIKRKISLFCDRSRGRRSSHAKDGPDDLRGATRPC